MSDKICVYAICKNEEQNVDRWIKPFLGKADYICVLDTGSTDDTLKKLKQYESNNIIIKQKIYENFHFDIARNDSMKLIPEDTTLCLVTDLDQEWPENWKEEFLLAKKAGFNKIYVNIQEDDDAQLNTLLVPAITDFKNWEWKYYVHEAYHYKGKEPLRETTLQHVIVQHHHVSSFEKSSFYHNLVIQNYIDAGAEANTDPEIEIRYWGEMTSSFTEEENRNFTYQALKKCDFSNNSFLLYRFACNAYFYARNTKQYDLALSFLNTAESTGIKSRYLYDLYANYYEGVGDYREAISYLEKMFSITEKNLYNAIENRYLFNTNVIERRIAYLYLKLQDFLNMKSWVLKMTKEENEAVICVNTICKDEETTVDRWISSLILEADYICVLDTGSTDNTVSLLKSWGPKVIVKEKNYDTFRFDTARNDALSLVPSNTSILIKTDLDEVWPENWRQSLIKYFTDDNYDCVFIPRYEYNEQREITDTKNNSCTAVRFSNEWYWEYPIHEALYIKDWSSKRTIRINDFFVQHFRDATKTRRDYFKMVQDWYNEEKAQNCLSLAAALRYIHELGVRGMNSEVKATAFEALSLCNLEHGGSYLFRLACNAATYMVEDNKLEEALSYLKLAETSGYCTRYLYNFYADIYHSLGKYSEEISFLRKELEIVQDLNDGTVEDSNLFKPGRIEDRIALVYFYDLKEYREALKFGERALQADPENERLQMNAAFYREKYQEVTSRPNRICVYSICRNEEDYVLRWWDSVKEADEVSVIVHDASDKTGEMLESLGVHVKYSSYPEWRFDYPKNDALLWAKESAPDCNILVYTALDEFFNPGWAQILRENWTPDTQQCEYNFVQWTDKKHNVENGTRFNWIHDAFSDWRWHHPIHELLDLQDDEVPQRIGLYDKIKLVHHPREGAVKDYVNLHFLRFQESPDPLSLLYLVRELSYKKRGEEAISYFLDYDLHYSPTFSYFEHSYLYTLIGNCYVQNDKFNEAEFSFKKAIYLNPEYRDPYLHLGILYCNHHLYHKAELVFREMISKSKRFYSWIECPHYWNYQEYIWISVAFYYQKKYFESFLSSSLSYYFHPEDNITQYNVQESLKGLTF